MTEQAADQPDEAAVRAGRLRRAGFPLLLIAGAVGVSLGMLEAGVRIFAPQPTKVSVPAILDPDLIYRLPANANGTDVKEEFAVTISTNSMGLRDQNYSSDKSEGVAGRILVLGDSMTFAEGVESEETYPKLLERTLTRQAAPGKFEVINAAIRGYGTDQEVVLFEKLIPIYHPDAVLLAFFAVNDFDDNLNGGLFVVREDRLTRQPLSAASSPKYRYYQRQLFVQTFPGYQFLIAHSHLVNLLRARWARLEFQRTFPQSVEADPSREDRAWRLTVKLLERLLELARQRDIRPFLLLIPSRDQIYRSRDELIDARTERVIAFSRQQKVPVLDPRQPLQEATAEGGPVFYPKDGHLTPRGHRIVAEHLHRFLVQQGMSGN